MGSEKLRSPAFSEDRRRGKGRSSAISEDMRAKDREVEGPYGNTLKRYSDWSQWIMLMIGGIALTYDYLCEEIAEHAISLYVMACRSLISFTFLAEVALMLLISYLLSRERINKLLLVTVKILIYITGVLMILTSASILLLLNPKYGKLVTIVLGMQLVILCCYYKGINTAHEVTSYGAHELELKLFFDISALVTVASFGGMMATIYNYFKNFSKDVDQVSIRISEVGIFFTVTLGLLEMLLTTVRPPLFYRNAGSRFFNLIRVHSCYLLGWLVLTVLSVGFEFGGKSIFLDYLIFFAVAVGSTDFGQAHSATGHQSLPDTSTNITSFIFAALIAALMAVYLVYFISKEGDFRLVYFISKEGDFRLYTFWMAFMSSAFVSILKWMPPVFKRPRTQSPAMAVRVLTYTIIGYWVFAWGSN